MNPAEYAEQLNRWQRWSLLAGFGGAALGVAGFFLNATQFFRSYLFAFVFWTGMGLGCLAILLLHHVVGGKWGLLIRRLCEAGAGTLPVMGLLFIPVALGMNHLYVWTLPEAAGDLNIQSKAAYLNVPFFLGRAGFYFVVWSIYAVLLTRWSDALDRTGEQKLIERMRSFSAPGLVVFVLTTTFAFVDWVMSLEPHWFSTVYGALFLVGQTLQAFALMIALLLLLSRTETFQQRITSQHIHDLGNLMFAFMVLWAYLSFSQFLLIWAGNLPEEIPWYMRRLNGGWGWVAIALVVFHFAVPFGLLLMRNVKRRADRLFGVCVLLLIMRLVDVYWVTMPAFQPQRFLIHWLDAVLPVAVGGLWFAAFLLQLKSRPLLPAGDPRLQGAPRETVSF